jgi:catechol 2,3-dioxygenase-like lactoylglutathione lyase family enzyme
MLNHLARVTHDVEATADFYSRILGMAIASTIMDDRVPSTGDAFPYFHIFFRMADGSTLAFFECTDLPAPAKPSHPAYEIFDHVALQVPDSAALRHWKDWLLEQGIEVLGPVDHKGLIRSIYFHDPNGCRLELTTPIDQAWNRHESRAQADLKAWVDAKTQALRAGTNVSAAMVDLIRRNKQSRHPTET